MAKQSSCKLAKTMAAMPPLKDLQYEGQLGMEFLLKPIPAIQEPRPAPPQDIDPKELSYAWRIQVKKSRKPQSKYVDYVVVYSNERAATDRYKNVRTAYGYLKPRLIKETYMGYYHLIKQEIFK